MPQFALGMGIGSIDVALVPLLATLVDSKFTYDDETTSITSNSLSYGGVYAIQQIRFNDISHIIFISCQFTQFHYKENECNLFTQRELGIFPWAICRW